MDFGRITLAENLVLYLFGTPGQRRFWFMWDDLVKGAIGAVVLVDTRRLDDSFAAVDYFEAKGLPFIVALNQFDDAGQFGADEIREALAVSAHIPVITVDARDRELAVAPGVPLGVSRVVPAGERRGRRPPAQALHASPRVLPVVPDDRQVEDGDRHLRGVASGVAAVLVEHGDLVPQRVHVAGQVARVALARGDPQRAQLPGAPDHHLWSPDRSRVRRGLREAHALAGIRLGAAGPQGPHGLDRRLEHVEAFAGRRERQPER